MQWCCAHPQNTADLNPSVGSLWHLQLHPHDLWCICRCIRNCAVADPEWQWEANHLCLLCPQQDTWVSVKRSPASGPVRGGTCTSMATLSPSEQTTRRWQRCCPHVGQALDHWDNTAGLTASTSTTLIYSLPQAGTMRWPAVPRHLCSNPTHGHSHWLCWNGHYPHAAHISTDHCLFAGQPLNRTLSSPNSATTFGMAGLTRFQRSWLQFPGSNKSSPAGTTPVSHEGHLGIEKLKQRCWVLVWWPGIDLDIEALVKDRSTCLVSGTVCTLGHQSCIDVRTVLLCCCSVAVSCSCLA